MTPASVMKRFKANGASLMSDFQRASPKMAWLPLYRITNESTRTKNCYFNKKFKQRVALAVELSIIIMCILKPNKENSASKRESKA